MRYSVLESFFGQEAEVSITGDTFTGIIERVDNSETEIAVIPSERYQSENFGKAIIDTQYIKVIRLVKPRVRSFDKKKEAVKAMMPVVKYTTPRADLSDEELLDQMLAPTKYDDDDELVKG